MVEAAAGPPLEEAGFGWEPIKVIELPTMLPAAVLGFANNGVKRILFVRTRSGVHSMDLD